MLDIIKRIFWIKRNAGKIKRHYKKYPYSFYDIDEFDDFNHEHICFASRITNVELSDICPLKNKPNLTPGEMDECERCKYFGIVSYLIDPLTGEKQIHFDLNKDVVSVHE